MVKNNNKNNDTKIKSNFLYKIYLIRNRKLRLKFDYLVGLKNEIENNALNFKANKLIEINKESDLKIKPILKKIEDNSRFKQQKDKAIKKYDNKNYWHRRGFKTFLVNKSEKTSDELKEIEDILAKYDLEKQEKRKDFIEKINLQFPEIQYSDLEIKKFNDMILKHKKNHALNLEKLEKKEHKLKEKANNKILRISKKLTILEEKINNVDEKILKINKQIRIKNDEKMKLLNSKIKILDNDQKKEKIQIKLNKLIAEKDIFDKKDIQLSIKNLKMYFSGIKAIDDLSFDVKRGEIFGLIGPNGAGKSTVFNCITQFYKPTFGNLFFRNKNNNIVDLSKLKSHDIIHEGISRSFQNIELVLELSVLDNLLVAAHSLTLANYFDNIINSRKKRREEMILRTKGYQILKNLGIEQYAFRMAYGLPYGVLKKIELARTLMTNPSMIILDEPAAGLNDEETADLAKTIKKINKEYKATIFLVEHDMRLIMGICNRVCAISFGKMLALDVPKKIQENKKVKEAYLGDNDE